MIDDIIEIGECSREFPSVDCLSGFSCVLERDTKIGATGSGGFLRCDLGCCVADLLSSNWWWLVISEATEDMRPRRTRIDEVGRRTTRMKTGGIGEGFLTILTLVVMVLSKVF